MTDSTPRWVPTVGSRLAVLRSSQASDGLDEVEIALSAGSVPYRIGVDIDHCAWIQVACAPTSVVSDDGSAAVRFTRLHGGYRVTIASNIDDAVAAHFLDDVVHLLEQGHNPGEAGQAALQEWRELLARPAGSPLGESALAGLFGELEVLELLLAQGGHLDYWTGWRLDHCDFRLPGLTLEVKTTMSPDYRRVRVHGLRQLDDPEDGSDLVLVLRRLELSPRGRSLPQLTDDIVRLGSPRSVLLDRLSQLGYSERHRAHYDELRFVSQELALRLVDDGHPRLIASMLAGIDLACIDKIDYELNLNDRHETDLPSGLDAVLARYLQP